MEEAEAEAVSTASGDAARAQDDLWGESGNSAFDELLQPTGYVVAGSRGLNEPSDSEARFEEGMPLVPREVTSPTASMDAATSVASAAFDSFGNDDTQDDFFGNVGKSAEVDPLPAPLDRKSTEQVLSVMAPSEQAFDKASNNFDLTHSTGGGIAVSTRTVAAQVLSETLQDIKQNGTASHDKEDLTALWQAALGDDDLLEDDGAIDPSSFFEDDGEGLLDDAAADAVISPPVPQPIHDQTGQLKGFDSLSRSTSGQYTPQSTRPNSAYVPTAAHTMSQPGAPYGQPSSQSTLAYSPYGRPALVQPPTPVAPVSTPQSYADQNKGGYTSPFDAPMDLSRPKRRPAQFVDPAKHQHDVRSMPPPPPRSSSTTVSPATNDAAMSPPTKAPPPSSSSYPNSAVGSEARPHIKSTSSSFFEELLIESKPRPPSAQARAPIMPPTSLPPRTPSVPVTQLLPQAPPTNYGLVAPQRQMSFTDNLQQTGVQPQYNPQPSKTAPPANTRYSPAPTNASQGSPARGRYAALPQATAPPRVPSVSSVNPYQPRTSSPLLHSSSASLIQPSHERPLPSLPHDQAVKPPQPSIYPPQTSQEQVTLPTRGNSISAQPSMDLAQAFDPSTIEPGQVRQRDFFPEASPDFSSHGPQRTLLQGRARRANTLHDERNFIVPSDGSEHDPMRRWQGAPILRFGFGGSVVTSFPKRVPRFTTAQVAPSIKCTPGEVNVHTSKILPLDEVISSFPGPLKAKSKKKDVLAWLSNGITRLEQEMMQLGYLQSVNDHSKRREESLLLWKTLRVFVECDGVVDGNPKAVSAIRQVLTPEVHQDPQQTAQGATYYQSPTIISRGETQMSLSAGIGSVEEIRKLLLQGEREKAVWYAVDQKLWGHAMLIASTLPPEVWKQVTQDFVKNEVKIAGDNTESLAALYDIFAGNWEESMDQLVPPSARAGFQMVSKTAGSNLAKNALDGLNRWRETLSMVLSNRSAEDSRSLASLGQLLLSYGRTEAAHICYLFARIPGNVSGADDPQAAIVLLGENHKQRPFDYAHDLYSVLLTEIYEFAICVLPGSPAPAFGHLQSFKLWHATMLAESGSSDQALQYCDAISSTLKASTKASPYYHARLFAAVDDLSNRIRSAPRDGSSSWISKPNMDKVSGSVWNKFTQFVAGDDSDAASVASKAEAEGPFSKISSDTPPSVSRGASPAAEQLGSYGSPNGYMPASAKPVTGNSRYAPRASHAPSEPSGINRQPSISSFESSSPDFHRSYAPQAHGIPTPSSAYSPRDSPYAPSSMGSAASPMTSAQPAQPQPPSLQAHNVPATARAMSDAGTSSPFPAGTGSPLEVHQPERRPSPYEPRTSSYAPRSGSYEQRSYQPSPKIEETSPPQNSYGSPPKNIPAEISTSGLAITAAQDTPTITHAPPIPVDPRGSAAQKSGYHPLSQTTEGVGDGAFRTYEPSPSQTEPAAYEPPTSGYEPPTAGYEPPTFGYEPPTSGYEPPTSSYAPPTSDHEPPASDYEPQRSSYEPQRSSYEPPSSSYQPPSSFYEPPSSSYEPPSSSYEPPSSSYEPPSASYDHSSTLNGGADAPARSPTKKKSIMDLSDDDDELLARAAALKQQQRAANDRAADEAFRKAAEADAAREKGPKLNAKSSGWLGGWFARGKAEESASSAAGQDGSKKPIKARLGEENSFYYDAELKKWVNRKGGADAAAPSAPTPPPPRGPPSRTPSAMGGGQPPSATAPPFGGPPRAPSSNLASGPPMGISSSMPPSGNASPGADVTGPPSGVPASGLAPPSRPG